MHNCHLFAIIAIIAIICIIHIITIFRIIICFHGWYEGTIERLGSSVCHSRSCVTPAVSLTIFGMDTGRSCAMARWRIGRGCDGEGWWWTGGVGGVCERGGCCSSSSEIRQRSSSGTTAVYKWFKSYITYWNNNKEIIDIIAIMDIIHFNWYNEI